MTDSRTARDAGDVFPQYGSDLAADVLRGLDIEYIALNPGASYRGLHDSIVNFRAEHTEYGDPEMIECTHEEIAIAVAHGYAKATGRIMAAGIHNVVGLQHASMAIFNAWCDRQPILVLGGGGPTDMELRRPTDWIHTALVQGNLVRDFTKWDDQPTSHAGVIESLVRAHRLAMTEPRGPVYVCLDAGLQEDALGEGAPLLTDVLLSPARPALAPQPDVAALHTIAEAVRSAEWPVILIGSNSTTAQSFAELAELAERFAIPVLDVATQLNLPNTHPMNLTGDARAVLVRADVIVALDVRDMSGALSDNDRTRRITTPIVKPGARIFSATLEDYMARGWSMEYQRMFPVEFTVTAQAPVVIHGLVEALGSPDGDLTARRAEVTEWHRRLRDGWAEQARTHWGDSPLAHAAMADALRQVLANERVVASGGPWTRRLFDLTEPGQVAGGSGGLGLGYSLGGLIGTCLAHRGSDRVVMHIQSDGDFLFTPGALWTLAHHHLPALIVMNNNRTYYNDEEHQTQIARFRGRDPKRSGVGIHINSPAVDFARVAEGMGVQGFGPIDTADALLEILPEALSIVKQGRPVLVDVLTQVR